MNKKIEMTVNYTDSYSSELPNANLKFEITDHNCVIRDFVKAITEVLFKIKA